MSSIGSMPSYLTSLYSSSTSLFPSSTSSTTVTTLPSIDSSTLVDYFSASESALEAAQEKSASTASKSSTNSSSSSSSNKSAQTPPWEAAQPSKTAEQAAVLATTNFIPATTPQLVGATASDSSTQKDNQKLFSLYTAVNSLSQLAGIAGKSGVTSGELQAYDTQFQTGLSQVESYLSSTTFNNFTLQTQTPSASVTSSVSIPFAPIDYTGQTIVSDANYSSALPNVSSSENFNIAVTSGGTTTNVPIYLSQVQGPLNITNIVDYINQQMQADGFKTRFSTTMTSGSVSDTSTAQYGIQISQAAGETINLSSAQATPSLYLAGSSGTTSPTVTTTPTSTGTSVSSTPADQQGKLVELGNLSSTPQAISSTSTDPSTGNTTAQSTVVDSNGNVYVLGNATGNMGNELNQGSQGVYLTMYDSAGNKEWSQLVSGSGSASGYSMALDPKGGVVIAGSTNSNLTTSGIDNGKNDSFVASYDSSGDQNWLTQIPTLNANQANAVTVDAQGNVYIGGQVTGSIGSGQTSSGGTNAYLATLNASGDVTSEQEFGPSGTDQVSAMATTQSGNLVVASQQNGQAVLSEYAGGSITSTPSWQVNLGNLNGGSISGVTISGNQVYVSGTTSNAALTAGGQATVANASSGGTNAFVFNATDNGTSATANYVSYVGNAGSSQGNGVTVGPDGTIYLAGTTTGTFTGQTRQVTGANNAFVASIGTGGQVQWTQQFGGADGQSSGAAVAINPTGSSVLNALGLPSGTVNTTQSVYLSQATSLQQGDSFQIQLEGAGGSTQTVTIGQNETLSSLANQINDVLLTKGKATVTYANGGEAIKIKVNPGVTANLIAGPTGFDALSRLGIQPGTLTAPAKKGAPPAPAATGSSTAAKTVYGLDLDTTGMNLQTTASAGAAKAELANVANIIENIYQQSNTPATSTSASSVPPTTNSTTVPAYLTSQISNYNLALASLESSSSSSSSSSSALLA